ncbi:hypothetical protein ACTXT7_014727 [Hymenolepis weldensis]
MPKRDFRRSTGGQRASLSSQRLGDRWTSRYADCQPRAKKVVSRMRLQNTFPPPMSSGASASFNVLGIFSDNYSLMKGRASSAAAKTLKDTYANDVVNEKIWRRWFSAGGFKKDEFGLKDESRAGCSKNSIVSNCKLP